LALSLAVAVLTAAGIWTVACSDSANSAPDVVPDAAIHRDVVQVEPPGDDATADAALPPGPSPSCQAYCTAVMADCTGASAQYQSFAECTAICAALPPGDAGDTKAPSVACRQYYAGSPAMTDPSKYCPAAGAWGGGVCGDDRCIAFCTTVLAYCSPDAGGDAPFASYGDCASACATFQYKDGGVEAAVADGGNEGLYGPGQGDTLNCRLFHLRETVHAGGAGCSDLRPDAGPCQ
jgi:hypothetical protein